MKIQVFGHFLYFFKCVALEGNNLSTLNQAFFFFFSFWVFFHQHSRFTSAHSWQPDSNREPLVSERKSLTTKLCALEFSNLLFKNVERRRIFSFFRYQVPYLRSSIRDGFSPVFYSSLICAAQTLKIPQIVIIISQHKSTIHYRQ